MEEIEYKLTSKNPVLILNVITKLVTAVQKAHRNEEKIQVHDLPEMRLLKKKCEDGDAVVSQTACQAIVALVQDGVLQVVPTLCDFIASIPFIVNYNGFISSVASLLRLELELQRSVDKTLRGSSLKAGQHPLTMLLKHNSNVWFDVLNQMAVMYDDCDHDQSDDVTQLLQPVFLHVLCDPTSSLPSDCRHRTWSLLLRQSVYSEQAKELLIDTLLWQPATGETLMHTCGMYLSLGGLAAETEDSALCAALAPSLAALVDSLMEAGRDPRLCLTLLDKLLSRGPEASSCVLMLLARTVQSCPAVHFKHLLASCLLVVERGAYNAMSGHMLLCSVLPWLMYPSCLAADGLRLAARILRSIQRHRPRRADVDRLRVNQWFCQLQNADHRVHLAARLCELSEEWDDVQAWLGAMRLSPDALTDQLSLFLLGLFLHSADTSVKRTVLGRLLTLAVGSNKLSSALVSVVLFQLAREQDPELHVELLRGLTEMAVHKENISLVVSTFELLKRDKNLQCLLIDLYARLWLVDNRCYPYLQPLLGDPVKAGGSAPWKLDLARAAVFKLICQTKPEVYGTELVPLLSRTVDRCGDERGTAAASLALQAIAALCQADVVDVVTTWTVLAPRIAHDNRIPVVISVCQFLSTVPSVLGQDSELLTEAVGRLWRYAAVRSDVRVVEAALTALAQFGLEHMTLKTLPEKYRRGIVLPKEYCRTPVDAARKPEDVLPYVPGECWLLMLQDTPPECLDAAGDLLTRWLDLELGSYRGGIFQVPASGEPSSCHHLHQRSLFRALTHHLQLTSSSHLQLTSSSHLQLTSSSHLQLTSSSHPQLTSSSHLQPAAAVVRQCLRILGRDRRLPPFNWSVLQQFVGQDGLRRSCLTLAARQAATSPSAKRFLENYVSTFQPSIQARGETEDLWTVLADLCKVVGPGLLRPALEKSVGVALGLPDLLGGLLGSVGAALRCPDISDGNRALLASQVEALLDKMHPDHTVFAAYVECVSELPAAHVEKMTAPSLWWEVTAERLRQAVAIRSALASQPGADSPLLWLNECIDATASLPSEQGSMLRVTASVTAACRGHGSNWRWIHQLLGKIQSVISGDAGSKLHQTEFLCSVLLVSTVTLSGHDCLSPSPSHRVRLELFPQALAALVAQHSQQDPAHIMEWLNHMQSSQAVSPMYNAVFRQGIIALRHTAYFRKPLIAERLMNK